MVTNSFCLRTKTRNGGCRFRAFSSALLPHLPHLPHFRASRPFPGQASSANRMETAAASRHGGCNACGMGDRFFPSRHGNITLLLQRQAPCPADLPAWRLPGIGHNGGPPLDMSGRAGAWRRAVAKIWMPPSREVALQRLRRAERLGLTYRDYVAALLDTGRNLSAALLPLHHVAEIRRDRDGHIALREDPVAAAQLRRFEGRLFMVIDEAVTGCLEVKARRGMAALLAQRYGTQVEGLLVLSFRLQDSDARRATRLKRALKTRRLLPRECFWLGRTSSELHLAQQAGLGLFKPLAGWFTP